MGKLERATGCIVRKNLLHHPGIEIGFMWENDALHK